MVKMRALRTAYVAGDKREYSAGETFDVPSVVDALTYVRRKRAEIVEEVDTRPKHVDIPAPPPRQEYHRRDMVAETPAAIPEKKPMTAASTPKAGRTGEAKPVPSSRQGRRSKAKT